MAKGGFKESLSCSSALQRFVLFLTKLPSCFMSNLPSELVLLIFEDYFNDVKMLDTGSCVCRNWTLPIQSMLFKTVVIESIRAWAALCRSLRTNANLRPLVWSLELRLGRKAVLKPAPRMGNLLPFLKTLHFEDTLPRLQPFMECSRLKYLIINLIQEKTNMSKTWCDNLLATPPKPMYLWRLESFGMRGLHQHQFRKMMTWLSSHTETSSSGSLRQLSAEIEGQSHVHVLEEALERYPSIEDLTIVESTDRWGDCTYL
jgi:hypothetical protein